MKYISKYIYLQKISDHPDAVKCICCNHKCIIPKNDHGKCNVRYNRDGKLYLALYGYPCALHIDPVEKKPLHHFLPGTDIYSVGTVGCNFKCTFCQNWDISQVVFQQSEKSDDIEDLVNCIHSYSRATPPEYVVSKAKSNGCSSIAFTYNEPSIWAEYSHDIGMLAKKEDIRCVYVSNGFMTEEHINYMKDYVKAINIDLKAWNPKFYRKTCNGNVEGVKRSIETCHKVGIWVEVTTLIIPDLNDSTEELTNIANFLVSVSPSIPWHISAFHPDYEMKDKCRTPVQTLEKAYDIGKKAGLKYIYVGNVVAGDKENTYCPKCHELLINRRGYHIKIASGFKGVCKCGEVIEGVWE